jgi:hypothetical protein
MVNYIICQDPYTSLFEYRLIKYPDICRGVFPTYTEAFLMPTGLNTTVHSD